MNPTVFLGLVTHGRTRFPHSATDEGLVRRLARCLTSHGVHVEVEVHGENHFDEDLCPLTQENVRRSIDAELGLEARWRRYVDPSGSRSALKALMAARHAYRIARLAPPWHRRAAATTEGAAMLRRLVNIELAHLHLLTQAHGAGAAWVLIVEDDAQLDGVEAFAEALMGFMARRDEEPQPAYINVSRSFGHERLGLEEHLTPAGIWSAGVAELASDLPLTNTVCAVLYRGAFLDRLLPALVEVPMNPVLPIDWKLNAALLALHEVGSLGPGDCWFLDPAPIVQGSMHDTAG